MHIEVYDDVVVPDIDPGDEGVDELLTEVRIRDVAFPERIEPGTDHALGQLRSFKLEALDLEVDLFLLSFQLGQPFGQSLPCAFFDRAQDVLLLFLVCFQSFPISGSRIRCLIAVLDLQDPDYQVIDDVVREHLLHGCIDHSLIQPLHLDRFQFAIFPSLFIPALVIVIHLAGLPGACLSVEHSAAKTTETFTAEQVVHLRPPCRVVAACFEVLRGFQEGRLVNYRLHVQRDPCEFPVARVAIVPQHPVDGTRADGLPSTGQDPAIVEELLDLCRGCSGNMEPEGFTDCLGFYGVDNDMAVFVSFVADRHRAGAVLSLFGRLPDPAEHLLTKVGGVVLSQSFQDTLQDDPFRSFRD